MVQSEATYNILKEREKIIEYQLTHSTQIESEYRELRKWNHDFSNHLISISYLMENQQYEEAMTYIEDILK